MQISRWLLGCCGALSLTAVGPALAEQPPPPAPYVMGYDRFPKDRVGAAVLGAYSRGGQVVTTGTTDWAHGLQGNDPAVTQITRNVLDRLSQ